MYGRWVRIAALLSIAIAACSGGEREACRPPTRREQVFPYTGTWRSIAAAPAFCLYQQDATRVVGSMGGSAVAGVVEPGGRLILARAKARDPVFYSIHLRRDTLTVDSFLTSDGREMAPTPSTWIRDRLGP